MDSSEGIYNLPIPKDKICDNEGWRFSLEDDSATLREYIALVEAGRALKGFPSYESFMGFYVSRNTESRDVSGALFVRSLVNNSNASGNSDLNLDGSFVRRSPVAKNALSIEMKG